MVVQLISGDLGAQFVIPAHAISKTSIASLAKLGDRGSRLKVKMSFDLFNPGLL